MSPAKKAPKAPTRDKNGFYTLPTGERCMSVTTLIKHGVPKDLIGWATWETAKLAVESVPKLTRVRGETARRDAVKWLQGASDRKRDAAGAFGSAIHDAVEAHILGQPQPEPTEDQVPFMAAFHRFVADTRAEFEATEITLAHPEHRWAGRGDVWMKLPDLGAALILGDWKTGSGVYPEAALQLSAYRRAPIGWLRDGTEVKPPATESAVIVHIRPDKHPGTGYAIYPVDTGDHVYAAFRAAQQVASWVVEGGAAAMGDPLDIPIEAEMVEEVA